MQDILFFGLKDIAVYNNYFEKKSKRNFEKMKKEISQKIMVWFLPIILIGGIFFPILGWLVFLMMIFFLSFSYVRGHFWCNHLCPRGAFLDLVLAKFSLKKKIPSFFLKRYFRISFLIIFIIFFILQIIFTPKNFFSIGFVFVRMCLITTFIAIFLGLPFKERTWCAFCPMGFLQEKIYNFNKKKIKNGKN